ncbi:hypothetical protein E2320_000053 [Naja naja]|nr:hypothetical protein E2320_000053 [Naja naja]
MNCLSTWCQSPPKPPEIQCQLPVPEGPGKPALEQDAVLSLPGSPTLSAYLESHLHTSAPSQPIPRTPPCLKSLSFYLPFCLDEVLESAGARALPWCTSATFLCSSARSPSHHPPAAGRRQPADPSIGQMPRHLPGYYEHFSGSQPECLDLHIQWQ